MLTFSISRPMHAKPQSLLFLKQKESLFDELPEMHNAVASRCPLCGSCGFTILATPPPPPDPPPPTPPSGQQYQQSGGAFHFDADGRGQGRGYTWEIEHQGAFALAVVKLGAEQAISAEAGAMVSCRRISTWNRA
jgi:hypothetical protein